MFKKIITKAYFWCLWNSPSKWLLSKQTVNPQHLKSRFQSLSPPAAVQLCDPLPSLTSETSGSKIPSYATPLQSDLLRGWWRLAQDHPGMGSKINLYHSTRSAHQIPLHYLLLIHGSVFNPLGTQRLWLDLLCFLSLRFPSSFLIFNISFWFHGLSISWRWHGNCLQGVMLALSCIQTLLSKFCHVPQLFLRNAGLQSRQPLAETFRVAPQLVESNWRAPTDFRAGLE